ncbi:mitosis initiation protein fs(1)Ya [Drosophila grimshawi]|uniref:GH12381 n=1 Tax=Drosophila grimshawi TaxID=7222 RepID=B4JIW3_DROGR|nr:mitosis initiation protein fs(1)Ya [Drosophila grimshawi]EDV99527.1 GH12381 [Drosophila grimshawi]
MYMRSFEEAKCQICKRIFCCATCRQKHQFEAHAIAVAQRTKIVSSCNEIANAAAPVSAIVYVFCPICEQKPLALHEEMYAELMAHIESVHLPLRCRKCQRNYTRIEDLREFTKCVNVGQDCSAASSVQNQSCDTGALKVTLKRANVAASSISTQTSPSIAKGMQGSQQQLLLQLQPQEDQQHHTNLTPISLFNLRWKAKSRLTQEELNSDSVSSIRNLSSDSVNLSVQQRRSIGLLTALPEKGKVIRSTSTPLAVETMFAKPKDTLTFNGSAVGGAHMSSIYHSGYVLDEQNPVPAPPDSNQPHQQQQQRAWKIGGRRKISGATPLRQVMSRSIQKAFVEHGVGILATGHGAQRRMRLDLSENNPSESALALDLRISPVVRRSQSVEESVVANQAGGSLSPVEPYQIVLSAQKLTTESIIITRTQHCAKSGSLAASASSASTSTVFNSCESVEIIASATGDVGANVAVPPITPITRIPGAIINKKLIKFETPQKLHDATQSTPDEEIFYTPNPSTSSAAAAADQTFSSNEQRRQQIVPRQLSGEFATQSKMTQPQGPRARPPLRAYRTHNSFSSVEDLISDDEDEVFLPNSASTHNDRKHTATGETELGGQSEPGRLWSLMSSVLRLPLALRTDQTAAIRNSSGSDDKENTATASTSSTGSLIRRCASIAGSLVRTMQAHDDGDMQTLKRKRTQTLDYQYCTQMSPSSSSSKRFRIQPRQPVKRMRNT